MPPLGFSGSQIFMDRLYPPANVTCAFFNLLLKTCFVWKKHGSFGIVFLTIELFWGFLENLPNLLLAGILSTKKV